MGFKMENAVLIQFNACQGSALKPHHVAQVVGSVNPALDRLHPVPVIYTVFAKIQLSGIQEAAQSDKA